METNYHVANEAVINQMDCIYFQDPEVPISHLILADDLEFAHNSRSIERIYMGRSPTLPINYVKLF